MRKVLLGLALGLTVHGTAYADGFGCSKSAGATIFYDTLYGLATGAIFSGLYVWSKNDDKGYDREKAFANGTMVGGALGFGLGIVEVSMRNCSSGVMGQGYEQAGDFRFAVGALPNPDDKSLMSTASLRYFF